MNLPTPELLSRALPSIGGYELLLILAIVIIVFGHNRIPQLGDALGKGIRNFKKSFAKDETEVEPTEREVQQIAAEQAPPVEQKIEQHEEQKA